MDVNLDMDATVAMSTVQQAIHADPLFLLAGIGLVALAIFVVFFLKRVIVNSILGLVAFAALWALGIRLPFILTLVVSIIFGLAGVGTMLIVYFLGLLG